ncbi:MAG TPA: helical backbone metal receptor [Candidatus Baltobacteraceae bacterium]|jgi:iron complex transport system substrate-binding protein|nr:helical backbone metal receptor [Candidatus Baltobacteraceae bacterium]
MRAILAAAAACALGACASAAPTHSPHADPARRIVSLMPSLTEDLCAIGARTQIVGVSEYSQDIACARGVPSVGNAASIDAERIVRLRADAVAAIPAQRALTEPLRRAGIATSFFNDDSYADIFSDIDGLGKLSGHSGEARNLAASLKSRTAQLRGTERGKSRPRVFVVIQAQPIWTVGPASYISELLRLAGATDAVAQLPQPYAQYSAEALVRADPDVIVATSDSGLRSALANEPWRSLRAVRARRVYILRDDAILVRPGPRYNEGLAWLIERLKTSGT